MPRLIIVCAGGGRGSGKSFNAAHLAREMPNAVVLDEGEWGLGEFGRLYPKHRHLDINLAALGAEIQAQTLMRRAEVIILCSNVSSEHDRHELSLNQKLTILKRFLGRDVPVLAVGKFSAAI